MDFDAAPEDVHKISELKRMADYWFRQYLLRHAVRKRGRIFCPIKKKWLRESAMQVCHFIDRSVMILRYDERNCILCSKESNEWDSKIPAEEHRSLHHKEYAEFLGKETTLYLIEMSNKIRIFSRDNFVELIYYFKYT